MAEEPTPIQIKQAVKEGYTKALGRTGGCCGGASPDGGMRKVQALGYAGPQLVALPQGVAASSFGCGNPLALAGIARGDVVLDIGSGAGMDCLLASEIVGPTGKVIGLDMTEAMLERARANAAAAGAANVEFRLGDAEAMPVDDASVDWVISNCVINLAPDKERVFREVARVLKPGGRVSVSDIVFADDMPELPAVLKQNMDLVVACIGGAIRESEYLDAMRRAGLVDVAVNERRGSDCGDLRSAASELAERLGGGDRLREYLAELAERAEGKVWSVRIVARKPVGGTTVREESDRAAGDAVVTAAEPADVPAITELLTAAGLPARNLDAPNVHFLVARSAGELVGCIGIERYERSALLRSFAVREELRGHGIGNRLGRDAIAAARAAGAREAVVLTHTIRDLARRAGFVEVDRSTLEPALASSWEFGTHCCDSATCMKLEL